MKMNIFPLLPALCLATAASAQQAPVTLTYRVENMAKNLVDSFHTKATYRFRVLEKLPAGKMRLEMTLLDYEEQVISSQYQRAGAPLTHFRSAAPVNSDIASSQTLLPALLLQQPVEVIFDPADRFGKHPQPALTALLENRTKEMGISGQTTATLTGNAGYFAWQEMRAIFPSIPEGRQAWQSPDSAVLYTVTGAPGGIRTITARENPAKKQADIHVTQHDKMTWDDAAGKVLAAEASTTTQGTYMQHGQSNAFRTSGNMRIRLVENAVPPPPAPEFLEMAIKTSSWSRALKDASGFEGDSAKITALLEKCDPVMGGSKQYVQQKLSLLQQIKGQYSYDNYRKALMTIPNYLLEGHYSHLHNKLQEVKGIDADSAMQLITYIAAAHHSGLERWMQHSLAQALFSKTTEADKEKAQQAWRKAGVREGRIAEMLERWDRSQPLAADIVSRMTASNNRVLSDAAKPMYLFQQAEGQTNADSLRSIAQQFREMSDKEKKSGNADRYGLMLYKKLRDQGMAKDAAAMLQYNVASLEKNTLDTLNKDRHTSQNMLAYAYQLQYEAALAAKDKDALNYLAKASAVSPRKASENTNDSFYDRVLLHSKTSYRDDYMSELTKIGDKQELMRVMAQGIVADPTFLPEAHRVFSQHLPGRSFKDFVHNTLVRSWQQAPDFLLKGADGQTTYRLSDFRGKWLLLDFWGTWCPPCREELPNIDALAQRVKTSENEAFLSIACYDTPENVERLFSAKGYSFPVSMSDGKVQGAYQVKGYPSKFIISPDGRMLPLPFSQNWAQTLEHFSKLQDAAPGNSGKESNVNKQLN